jgi:hypothetical protein
MRYEQCWVNATVEEYELGSSSSDHSLATPRTVSLEFEERPVLRSVSVPYIPNRFYS